MTKEVIYHGDPYNRVFFFSIDYYQEFDKEVDFVPVSVKESTLNKVRSDLLTMGYAEMPNPDKDFQPSEPRCDGSHEDCNFEAVEATVKLDEHISIEVAQT